MDSQTLQGLIEDLPPEERGEKTPLDWNVSELLRVAVPDGLEKHVRRLLQPTASDDEIRLALEAEGKDAAYIEGYLSGWHKKPFNKA